MYLVLRSSPNKTRQVQTENYEWRDVRGIRRRLLQSATERLRTCWVRSPEGERWIEAHVEVKAQIWHALLVVGPELSPGANPQQPHCTGEQQGSRRRQVQTRWRHGGSQAPSCRAGHAWDTSLGEQWCEVGLDGTCPRVCTYGHGARRPPVTG